MDKLRILLAEDETNMGTLLRDYLGIKGYTVDWLLDGEQALKYFMSAKYDICILDIMMPKKDGFTIAREIRQIDTHTPIIFLTAKSMYTDILDGFTAGADDYLTKPFSIEELLLRIEAILRRTRVIQATALQDKIFNIGSYTFDFTKRILSNPAHIHILTNKEAELLHLLCINKNQVLDRDFALSSIWYNDTRYNARSMDVYITKLRKYMKDDSSIAILNVRGRGFKLIS